MGPWASLACAAAYFSMALSRAGEGLCRNARTREGNSPVAGPLGVASAGAGFFAVLAGFFAAALTAVAFFFAGFAGAPAASDAASSTLPHNAGIVFAKQFRIVIRQGSY